MKKILFASIALALGFASCVKEQVNTSSKNGNSGGITVTASTDGTRTSVTDTYTVSWANDDQIDVWDGPGADIATTVVPAFATFSITSTSNGGKSATFQGDLAQGNEAIPEDATNRTLYASYPVSGTINNNPLATNPGAKNSFAKNGGALPYDIPVLQLQNGNSDIDGQYLYMWAEPVRIDGGDPTDVNFKFMHLCAVLDIPITGVPANERVTKVEIGGDDGKYDNYDLGKTSEQKHPKTPFMNRMQISRLNTVASVNDNGLIFENVSNTNSYYFSNSVGVQIDGLENQADVTAHIAVFPRDLMKDKDGNPMCNPLPTEGAVTTRDLWVKVTTMVTTMEGETVRTYTVTKNGVDTHKFIPGKRLTFDAGTTDGKIDLTAMEPDGDATYTFIDNQDGTITVSSAQALADVATVTNLGDATKYKGFAGYTLNVEPENATIDLSDLGDDYSKWTPIGNAIGNPFKGTFNGKGVTIKNLILNGAAGLFGYATGDADNSVTIKDIKIAPTGKAILTGTGGTLLIAGDNVKISGCSVTGNGPAPAAITISGGGINTAALVGTLNNSSIEDCSVTDVAYTTTSGANNQGLILGSITTPTGGTAGPVTVSNCSVSNSSFISGTGYGNACIGNIVGFINIPFTTITGCTVTKTKITTNLTTGGSYVNGFGGIAGTVGAKVLIIGCLVTQGSIYNAGTSTVGGIAGSIGSGTAVINCVNDRNPIVTNPAGNGSNAFAGGIVGNTSGAAVGGSAANSATLIMGCTNNSDMTGGSNYDTYPTIFNAKTNVGGICGCNVGLVVGCKNTGGTITSQSNVGTVATDGNATGISLAGGICGQNSGVVSACLVTGGTILTSGSGKNTATNVKSSIIAPGTTKDCYYAADVFDASSATIFTTVSAAVTGDAADFAGTEGPMSGEGWVDQPNGWGTTYAPDLALTWGAAPVKWTAVAIPWVNLGNAPDTYPILLVEDPTYPQK